MAAGCARGAGCKGCAGGARGARAAKLKLQLQLQLAVVHPLLAAALLVEGRDGERLEGRRPP
jgi:hypothetical protein